MNNGKPDGNLGRFACSIWQITDTKTWRNVMQKHALAVTAAILMSGLSVSIAAAAHHHAGNGAHHSKADLAIRDGYIMNGNFDWRRARAGKIPWYAHGYSDNCVAWTPHAYHYACDPNGRY
jgi:hypothetical protein